MHLKILTIAILQPASFFFIHSFLAQLDYKIMLKKYYIKKQFFVQTHDDSIKDSYQIKEILGRGSFATVYKAKMKFYPYTTRAVKRINKKFIKHPNDILNQYQILASFDHPQIIKIYQTFQDNQNFYFVLDYCEGGELFSRLEKQGNFTQSDARILFTQMVNIINYCHQNKVAHRDLKPQNFMMVSNKNGLDLMLIDFGLSFKWKKNMKSQLQKIRLRQSGGHITGTAYYMSPEIFKGIYDQRCDIWSLGIILFMLVTGEPPYAGSTNQEILNNVRAGKLNLHIIKQKQLNPKLVDLLYKIFIDQNHRISLKEIISHPWMTTNLNQKKLNVKFQKIRKFSKLSKFQVLILNYIASQLPQKDIMMLGKVFLQIDANKDGYLTVEQMANYFKEHPGRPQFEDMNNIIRHIDVDSNGKLAYNEFISACLSKSAIKNRYFDLNHDGKISKEELTIVLKAYKNEYSQNVHLIDKLLDQCDLNHDNQIDFQEFSKYLVNKNSQQSGLKSFIPSEMYTEI